MIIETTDNRFFTVRETNNPRLEHVWFGTAIKRNQASPDGWVYKKGARETLVSKAHCLRIIEA